MNVLDVVRFGISRSAQERLCLSNSAAHNVELETGINEDLRKLLGTQAVIDHIKRQQIKWFGHVIRPKNNTKNHQFKKYENTRLTERPRKRWIGEILEVLKTLQLKRPTVSV
jgi:hypothetical protein